MKRHPLAFVYVATLSALVTGCVSEKSQHQPRTAYLDAAIESGRWLQSRAEANSRGFIPDQVGVDSVTTASLGAGASGRALFFLELFHATGDSTFLQSARVEAHAAVAATEETPGAHGLYNGLAGVAFALTEVSKVTRDAPYRQAAESRFEEIVVGAEATANGIRWGAPNDVIVGAAGVGLALLYAAREFDRADFLDAARAAGSELLASADSTESGLRWFRATGQDLDLPNFSHGTAGVAYFLAELSASTGDPVYLDAAERGAAYLMAVSDTSNGLFLVPYGIPNQGYVTKYDVGWAHGPAGTSRLFYALWVITDNTLYRDAVGAGAKSILASGLPGETSDTTRWSGPFPIDQRFGLSGVIPFLTDWNGVQPGAGSVAIARASADTILARSTGSDMGLSWTIPQYGFQGDGAATYTGYFYGSAGMGMALLAMHYAEAGGRLSLRLPDDPWR